MTFKYKGLVGSYPELDFPRHYSVYSLMRCMGG